MENVEKNKRDRHNAYPFSFGDSKLIVSYKSFYCFIFVINHKSFYHFTFVSCHKSFYADNFVLLFK